MIIPTVIDYGSSKPKKCKERVYKPETWKSLWGLGYYCANSDWVVDAVYFILMIANAFFWIWMASIF